MLRAGGAFEEGRAHAPSSRRGPLRFVTRDGFIPAAAFDEAMETASRSFVLRDAHDRKVAAMRSRGRVLVAVSGGVDSGLVARVAHEALGATALAACADEESLHR